MFDFIRNLTKSAEEKRLETLNAYLDGELSAREQRRFEQELEQDAALRAEMVQLRQVKQGIGQLPRARAPRNFTLDPALYGRPQPQPTYELYPVLRVATALAAFFFIVAVVLDLATPAGGLGQPLASFSGQQEPAAVEVDMAEEAAEAEQPIVTRVVEEVVVEGESVEVTRVVTETVEEEQEEMAAAAEEAPAEAQEEVQEAPEEPVEEEAMEAEMASEPDEERTVEPTEDPAAEAEALTAPTEDTAAETAEADDGADAPAAAAPAPATTVTEATAPAEPLPTLTSEAPEAEALPTEEPVEDGLPILLIAEIVFGVGLVVLLTVTLLMRRNL